MKFKSLEEVFDYIEKAYSTPVEERTGEVEPDEVLFDYNTKALNALFRNAMNEKSFAVAYDIIVYANEQHITLTKGR